VVIPHTMVELVVAAYAVCAYVFACVGVCVRAGSCVCNTCHNTTHAYAIFHMHTMLRTIHLRNFN